LGFVKKVIRRSGRAGKVCRIQPNRTGDLIVAVGTVSSEIEMGQVKLPIGGTSRALSFGLAMALIANGNQLWAQSAESSPVAISNWNSYQLTQQAPAVQPVGYSTDGRMSSYFDDSMGVSQAAPEIASQATDKTDKTGEQDEADKTNKEDADIEEAKKEIEKSLKQPESKKEKAWYEKMKIRGYSQFRYNRIAETNPDVRNPQGDRSIGEDGSFLIRRARMIFSGDAGERISYYIQPDFASGATGPNPLHFLQIRDFYADVHLDMCKEHRLRIGQSKVPYGFENLQSSQNRLALDRNDALNSAVVNERDLGVFYYWAPTEIRSRFKSLVDDGLKGSGDYGVLGLGIYNGQTANRPERNDGQHVIGRISYPFLLANGQIFEPGLSGYTGTYTIDRSAGIGGGNDFLDRRGAVSFTLYPQPLGLQGEWTWGEGPELNAAQTAVELKPLEGGYMQFFYKFDDFCLLGHSGTLLPFIRIQRYDGGRKHDTNSPSQKIREAEVGFEYQFSKALEFTTNYTFAERTFLNSPYQQENGSFIRTQLQWNY
jgi:Phosphate-selective porin O and P